VFLDFVHCPILNNNVLELLFWLFQQTFIQIMSTVHFIVLIVLIVIAFKTVYSMFIKC
jgi:hypothetical protein